MHAGREPATARGDAASLLGMPTMRQSASEEDALLATPLEDAREALAYWRGRLATLPLRRRAQRREARTMVANWEARVRRARLAALPGPLQWVLAAVADLLPSRRSVAILAVRRVGPVRRILAGVAIVAGVVAVTWLAALAVIVAALL